MDRLEGSSIKLGNLHIRSHDQTGKYCPLKKEASDGYRIIGEVRLEGFGDWFLPFPIEFLPFSWVPPFLVEGGLPFKVQPLRNGLFKPPPFSFFSISGG